jgi:RNA polymerase sigma-70 factor (ECF subfamily)
LLLGQEPAVRWWYQKYARRLTHYVTGKLSRPLDVEELVQEIFMKSLHNLPNFSQRSSLWTWMCALANHEVADYYRKLYAKKVLSLRPLTDNLLTTKPDDAHELAEKINQVWQAISSRHRELLLQKYIDKKKTAEIAQVFGKTSKAIESELWRARQEFKKAYLKLDY